MDKQLIFDIGLHKGLDAQFYLQKGFRVVGLEASGDLCQKASALNGADVKSGRLTVVQKALYYHSNETVEFFVNPDKDDWGSLFQGAAEKGVGTSVKISVATISLQDLILQYGVPYYIKCDIEGGDAIFAEQLVGLKERPVFVSIEATQADDLAQLRACGYDRFQIVNQYNNPWTAAPEPSREGHYVKAAFSHEMSGLFGKDLDPAQWVPFAAALHMFLDWYDLKARNPNLAIGWCDVHACHSSNL